MQKILITGARSGIMSKVIDRIKRDYYVYLTVHTESELQRVKEKYQNYPNIECFKLDVTNENDVKKILKLDIDIFISNAAIAESGSVLEMNIDKIRKNFEINVFANMQLVQVIVQKMLKKGQGRIIVMASLAGKIPLPFAGAYSATKASLIKLIEALKIELKLITANIDLVLILPGLYQTGFNKLMVDKKYDDQDFIKYFDHELELIRKSENLILTLFEKQKLNSIVNKIVKAITLENPKFIYSAPLTQNLFAKIVSLFY